MACFDGVVLSSWHIPVGFPDYEPLLGRAADVTATIGLNRRELLSCLEAFDGDPPIVLCASATRLEISRAGIERSVAANVRGTVQPIAVNPAYAIDAAANAVGPEVLIEISGSLSPLVFRSADDGTYVSLLMPFKLG